MSGWDNGWDNGFSAGASPNLQYHDMMASTGNLRDDEQEMYNSNRRTAGLAQASAGFVSPETNGMSGLEWWNDYAAGDKKQAPVKKPRRDSDSESGPKYEVPLVNLEAPSPLIWVVGLALIMTITFVCETIQVGGYADIKTNPMWGPDDTTMLQMGAKYGPLIQSGEWWRLFSATFLQNGLIFYILSMFVLFVCRNVEREAGWWRAVIVFMLSSTFGYIISSLFVPNLISCGTTGGMAGYLGLMISDLIAKWRGTSKPLLRLIGLIFLVAILIIVGLTPFVDNFLHIGGLVMGFMAALMLMPNLNFGECEGKVHAVLAFIAFPFVSTVFMFCLVLLFRRVDGDTPWCSWCVQATCYNITGWCKDTY